MAYQFGLSGSYTTIPLDGVPSLAPTIGAPIDETMTVATKTEYDQDLTVDTPVAVQFGGVSAANVVILKSTGGKVQARISSADGSSQVIPFDTVLILMSLSVPITAISLVRIPATETLVRVYLAQAA